MRGGRAAKAGERTAAATGSGGELQVTLELDRNGFVHAGEMLRARLEFECSRSGMHLPLATIQLNGELVVDPRHVSVASLEAFKDPTRPGASAEYGGGTLVEEVRRFSLSEAGGPTDGRGRGHRIVLLSTPPSVIAAGLGVQAHVQYIFEWSLELPADLAPSWEGQSCSLRYGVLVGLQLPGGARTVFGSTVNVLPSFADDASRSVLTPASNSPPLRCHQVGLSETPAHARLLRDPGLFRCISPERQRLPSLWSRYLEGRLPRPADLRRYPLCDPGEPGGRRPEGQAVQFNVYSLNSPPAYFSIPIGQEVIFSAKLNKTHLRLGETIVCTASLPPSPTWSTFQMRAALLCTERLAPSHCREAGDGLVRTHRTWEGACWMHHQLSFALSLPSDANPTLHSNLVSFQWSLQITLVCARKTARPAGSPILAYTPACSDEKTVVTGDISLTVLPNLAVRLGVSSQIGDSGERPGTTVSVPIR